MPRKSATEASPVAHFEQSLDELEQLVGKMEHGEMSLEASLAAYERGVGLYRRCQAALEQAELRVRLLTDPDAPDKAVPTLHAGERWRFTVRLKRPHGNVNPHGFDYELWLWEQGIGATGYVRTGRDDPAPERIESTWKHPLERARQSVRDAILERVDDRKAAGILAALVTGDQAAIERADWDVFRATGVAHLMSISGLHVTMFAWFAAALCGWLWRRSARLCIAYPAPHAALIGGVLLATSYALFSGWGVPAQRTVLMLAVVSLLKLSGRRWPWPQVWLVACATVAMADPWALTQAGFWLSFVAVGILFATDSGAIKDQHTRASARFGTEFGLKLLRMGREQALITFSLAPLTLLLFNQLSLVALPANAVAIPWVTLVVTPLALGGVLFAPLWDLAALAVQALGWFLGALAQLPFATVSLPSPDPWTSAAGLFGGLLLALKLPWSLRLLGLAPLLALLLWQPPRPAHGEFELLAADIGQGNAVLVRTASHALLYDAGPRFSSDSDAGSRVLVPLLRALGERLDLLVLSHSDSDHTGGAAALLAMQPRAALLSSIAADHPLQALRAVRRCEAGQGWQWDGVKFDVLHPRAADYLEGARPNSLSCVLRISNGRRSALLVGDIEAPQEARLVVDVHEQLAADVLLVPHHGSKTSSSEVFLDAVKPRIALVQAGYRNRFGHPAAPVEARYDERGIAMVGSASCGAARWRSSEPATAACERELAPRYWRPRLADR